MKFHPAILSALLFLVLGWTAGCQPSHQQIQTFLHSREHVASASGYTLAPTDKIRIFAPEAEEVAGTYTVRADGTIHLKLLGNVRIAGLTAREAGAKVQRELRTYYQDPTVQMVVDRYNSKFFILFGEIGSGRGGGGGGDRGGVVVPITGRDTVMSVLVAHAPSQNAWMDNIHLIRAGNGDRETQTIIIDYRKMMTSGDRTQNYLLQEGDVLWIPPTPMAWVGYRIRELLQPIAPVLDAYTSPARIMDADDEYDDDDDNDSSSSALLSGVRLPF